MVHETPENRLRRGVDRHAGRRRHLENKPRRPLAPHDPRDVACSSSPTKSGGPKGTAASPRTTVTHHRQGALRMTKPSAASMQVLSVDWRYWLRDGGLHALCVDAGTDRVDTPLTGLLPDHVYEVGAIWTVPAGTFFSHPRVLLRPVGCVNLAIPRIFNGGFFIERFLPLPRQTVAGWMHDAPPAAALDV